jgi:protein-S-isoprenylcysteine O-methyltransferase Ste14
MVGLGRIFFRYRGILFPLAFAIGLLAGHPADPFGRPELNAVFILAGVVVALLGEALRALTIGYEYIIRGGRNHQAYAEKLVAGGVFAHCRNPMYVGNILIALGLALMIHTAAFYLIFIPFMLFAYHCITASEEAYLRGKFGGEYDEYCRRVNRWWPRWSGFAKSTEGMRFNWRRLLVKEFNTAFALVVGLFALEILREYRVAGTSEALSSPYVVIGAIVWLSLYLVVRTLKKTRRLIA